MKFDELELPEPLLQAIADLGFDTPTAIQEQALPIVISGRDVAGQAQTGTGKTACFLLGLMTTLLKTERPKDGSPRALIIAPTRELALQIADDAVQLATYTDYNIGVACGGLSWTKQAKAIEEGVDIIVGTPGRLMDFEKKRVLNLRRVAAVVVDEADRMFDMGFIEDLTFIFRRLPRKNERQSMLFSATLSHKVMRLAYRFMNEPVEVKIKSDLVVAEIEQELYHVGRFEKLNLLLGLLQKEQPHRTMIFVNRKVDGERLTWKLNHNGYEAVYLSGDLAQKKRLRIIEGMKQGLIEILVATDVASRGIHVDDVTHVFNFDIPQDPEDYVHRIGRTARAGNSGRALALADEESVLWLEAVEDLIGEKIPSVFADDDMYVPDRSGRFHRQKNVYTGWPPASVKGKIKPEEGDEEDDERPPRGGGPPSNNRRRSGGGGGGRSRR